MVKFITNHHMAHALYRKHNKLELLKPGMSPTQANLGMQSCGIQGKTNIATFFSRAM